MRLQLFSVLVTATFVACGGTSGARPHDMSAAAHETTAASEERAATEHDKQYDPDARRLRGCGGPGAVASPCWAGSTNPTDEHRRQAADARARAAEHRAASQALRDAEARACAGLDPEDRDESPFAHREDIASVERLDRRTSTVSGPARLRTADQLAGAKITFRAVRGLSAPWLQRVVDCHLARNAALGHDVPEMGYCPLVPKEVSATVSATQSGFAISIRGENPDAAEEVWRRARALTAAPAK